MDKILITTLIVIISNQKHHYYAASLSTDEYESQNNFLAPSSFSFTNQEKYKTVEDTTCNVEQVEEANDSQLYVITKELKKTLFFRTFSVDLDHGCPLTGWKRLRNKNKKDEEEKKSKDIEDEMEKEDKNSDGNDDGEEGEKEEECTCGIDSSMGDDIDDRPLWEQDNAMSSIPPLEMSMSEPDDEPGEEEEVENNIDKSNDQNNDYDDDFDEDTFECTGGAEEEDEDDLDAPDEPLCSVEGESFSELATKSLSPVKELFSSALATLLKKCTWDSESQRNTFSWFQPSDPIIILDESDIESSAALSDCDDDDNVPDTFWIDMCSEIKQGDGLQLVNLELNPERNTGYNGTHIWNTIYEENCIMMDKETANMCYEERVLYRLLSGLHTSTTLSIATNYYPPSKRKNRLNWEPNPTYFYKKFEYHPEYIRNLHFSYLVMLRALRKAKNFLYNYEIRTGDIVEDEKATVLLRRLLDTHILTSCSDVFDAFDESLMFNKTSSISIDDNDASDFITDTTTTSTTSSSSHSKTTATSLRHNFKGVFHNISSILDCVQCQQCKLHGKMAMLGYGTALKILFTKNLKKETISRNELVAFINTICKFSESLKEIRLLTNLYWVNKASLDDESNINTMKSSSVSISSSSSSMLEEPVHDRSMPEKAVSVIVELSKQNKITIEEEIQLVQLALNSNENHNLLLLVKYYHDDLERLLLHTRNSILNNNIMQDLKKNENEPDAIIIGSGLAGLVTAVQILDRGGKVTLIDKEHTMGGNSAKASSGMNGCCLPTDEVNEDTTNIFQEDTIKSAGSSAQIPLIETLVQNSARALTYLSDRIGIDLSLVAQLGGHSRKRTHRPNNGMVGAEVIYGMTKVVKEFEKKGKVKILLDCKVTQLLTSSLTVTGVKYQNLKTNETFEITSPRTVLASGGFAHARSTSTGSSLLSQYRPEYVNIPATAGDFSTGDGIALATTTSSITSSSASADTENETEMMSLNANTVDMEHIQIHPTGWIDPSNEHSHSKTLAAELLRGVGGILLSPNGTRFCNEVGTRSYVSDQMLIQSEPKYNITKKWDVNYKFSSFYLLLSSSAAIAAKKHVDLYTYKGLMTKIVGLKDLAAFMNDVPVDTIRRTFQTYQHDANNGYDAFGKTTFNNVRTIVEHEEEEEIFYVGRVTPVLHYCMGGLQITSQGQVLNTTNHIIPGLHAVGEVSGGVHGVNRLAGNSLLECTVFGMLVGESIPIASGTPNIISKAESSITTEEGTKASSALPSLTLQELSKHSTPNDCWISIHNKIYNLTEFALEHPAGPESIYEVGGVDATDAFETVHNVGLLDDFDDVLVGTLV